MQNVLDPKSVAIPAIYYCNYLALHTGLRQNKLRNLLSVKDLGYGQPQLVVPISNAYVTSQSP